MKRVARAAAVLFLLLIVSVVGGGLYVRRQLQKSLPIQDGTIELSGLDSSVTIERDHLGVPTITAASRLDATRALGFLHAQERFFQMDLQRRQAAGELSALVGARALEVDQSLRVHRFRHLSRKAIAQAAPPYRATLDAYAQGVNEGVAALGAAPGEYLLLRRQPDTWKTEDTILTILAMFNTLQGRQSLFEGAFGTLADTMPPAMYDFLTARGSEWDAPMSGGRFPRPPIPSADVFTIRTQNATATEARKHGGESRYGFNTGDTDAVMPPSSCLPLCDSVVPWRLSDEEAAGLGSNNWAVAGTHTSTEAALVANDMHLTINVPNIWYRASIVIPDPRQPGVTLRLTGVTLPGLPSLVVGSNGHVAWGFTNTGGDWSDLVIVEGHPQQPDHYLTPDGPRPFEKFDERIDVAGDEAQVFPVRWTIWGPVIRHDHKGRDLVQRWVAHDAAVLAADTMAPENARNVDEALRTAAGLGIPAQNLVVGDTTGRIGWTIAGPIPRRVGFDGSRPTSWADGTRRWNGYLSPESYPRIVDPPSGRLWTANAAVVDGEMLLAIGDGGYADGIRARVIRDRLMAITNATPADMLSVQLDNSALFHERWRALVLKALTPAAVQANSDRAEFRHLIETTWTGKAEPASISYRLVRAFRATVVRQVFDALTATTRAADPSFDYSRTLRSEGPLWQLVTERPLHLVNRPHTSWDEMLLAAVDTTIAELTAGGVRLSDRSWGQFNRASVTHPLGGALPLMGRWLNMPADPLPGDIYTPRAHSPRAGPSERMVVSPGREHEGVLHMPTGQSGHPLSPHYRDQHRAWLTGEPLPFLPGPAVSRLHLKPRNIE